MQIFSRTDAFLHIKCLHFSHLPISFSAELWEFSAGSLASSLKKAKLQVDAWSKIPSFFSALKKKKNLTFENISYLESVFFSKKMKLFVSISKWTKEGISSGSSAEFGNCLFSRASGQAVRWFHLKKASCSLEHIFSHVEETTVIFIVLGFCLFAFITFDSYFK